MLVGILEKLPRRKIEPPTPDTDLNDCCTTIRKLCIFWSNFLLQIRKKTVHVSGVKIGVIACAQSVFDIC
jgi:hypothetical protein